MLFIQPLLAYVADEKHLRKFPSPSYASLASSQRILKNLQCKHFLAVHEAHQKLGAHVQIAANHISISEPQAAYDICGHCARSIKDAWYDDGADKLRNMADARLMVDIKQEKDDRPRLRSDDSCNFLSAVLALEIASTAGGSNFDRRDNRKPLDESSRKWVKWLGLGK